MELSPLLENLFKELDDCRRLSRETPLVNPYQQMSYRLLKRLKGDENISDNFDALIEDLSVSAFQSRAKRASLALKETQMDKNRATLKAALQRRAEGLAFEDFKTLLEREIAGIVITAHPTFGFSRDQYDVLSKMIQGEMRADEVGPALKQCTARPDQGLSLEYEFLESENALLNLQKAIRCLYEVALDVARDIYPEDWKTLNLRMVTAASWVGFDVDGRDDITWLNSVGFRYQMALRQCEYYLDAWDEILKSYKKNIPEQAVAIKKDLESLKRLLKEDMAHFPEDKHDAVRAFSRHSVKSRENKEDFTAAVLSALDHLILQDKQPQELLVFRSILTNFGIGFSHIHFRLNAVQLHNAIRPLVAMEKDPDDSSTRRQFMTAVSKLLDNIEAATTGYENIEHEQTTAKRLFMIVAQFQKYIDAKTPIRFLIAESDTPFTVMAALCYAKMFGVADNVDISPLFETDEGLERGARIIEELLENPHYYAYVKKRGRLCIQAGYSDAGRYLGQVAAGLAIERLRIKVAQLWQKFDLSGVELVIFDTGGEGLGRGAHPEGFDGRLNYMHTPEARSLMAKNNIRYKQEFSLQGGDGYLWLRSEQMAFATLSRVMENLLAPVKHEEDPFYQDTDWSLDFFLTVKNYNSNISNDPDYMKLLSLLGPEISYPSGSRMTIRRDEGVLSRGLRKISQIRAIPNNMLLHQMGYLANSLGGVGTAMQHDADSFWAMYKTSPRLRHIMKSVFSAVDLSDEDVLGSYMALFRPRYWMHCARYENETTDHQRMLRLATKLNEHGDFEGLNRIELKLREDLMQLKDGIKSREAGAAPYALTGADRGAYSLLHVLRMTLIQKIFLLLTRIPRFRDHKGISVDDLIMQILRFQLPAALTMLREIFPTEGSYEIDPENPEKITFKADDFHGYEYENRMIFDEIEKAYDQIRKISLAITAYVGAIG